MAGLINLQLLADFFNKIGPFRQMPRCTLMSASEVMGKCLALRGTTTANRDASRLPCHREKGLFRLADWL
jgi:hypothetical protein